MGAGALTVASLGLTFMSMQAQRSAYEAEAQQAQEQAQMAKISAQQQEAERNRKLRQQLAALNVSMAAGGTSLGTSASTLNLAEQEEKLALADIQSIRLMGQSQRRKYGLQAAGAKAAKKGALYAGVGQMAGTTYNYKYG
tara:strand:+ start:211 stop:630 length:420 start_codon:yes stop_codon:yes gene_type:complete